MIKAKNQTQTLADFLRDDPLFYKKNITDSKLRKLLTGLALEFGRLEQELKDVYDGYDISSSEILLTEWESAMGIPDDCFITYGISTTQRAKNVLTKLTALGVSTKSGFEALAATFGYTATVEAGTDVGLSRWTMKITLPDSARPLGFVYSFPLSFGTGDQGNIVECLFSLLKPSNVKLVFSYI